MKKADRAQMQGVQFKCMYLIVSQIGMVSKK